LGQNVETFLDKEVEAGNHKIIFKATGLASGIYFYSITSGSFNQTRKMILAK